MSETKHIDGAAAAAALNERLASKGWKRSVSCGGSDWGLRVQGDPHGMDLLCADGKKRYFGGPFVALSARTADGEFKTVVRYG